MRVFHVVCNLEDNFKSLDEAKTHYSGVIYPKIPVTAGVYEDKITPRICVSPTIEGCLSGIKLIGRLKRCLAANEDAKSYETLGLEVYPVIILEFDILDDYLYKPSRVQVPDVDITDEYWIRVPMRASKVRVRWLNPSSIIWMETHDKNLW